MIIEAQRLARALPPVGTVERRLPRRAIEGQHATRGNKQPLRYPMDDAALRIIIKDGIMDKGMLGTRDLSYADVTSLIAYLRASSKKGGSEDEMAVDVVCCEPLSRANSR
jgi:hypothetical protein